MSKYQIRACFESGCSDKSWDEEVTLEMVWEDLNKAAAALQRIKDHYKWYRENHDYSSKCKKIAEPEWHKGLEDYIVKVVLDNGESVQFIAPWCGYFEKLYFAEIVLAVSLSDKMKISF